MSDDSLTKELLRAAGEGAAEGLVSVTIFAAIGFLVWAASARRKPAPPATGESQLERKKR